MYPLILSSVSASAPVEPEHEYDYPDAIYSKIPAQQGEPKYEVSSDGYLQGQPEGLRASNDYVTLPKAVQCEQGMQPASSIPDMLAPGFTHATPPRRHRKSTPLPPQPFYVNTNNSRSGNPSRTKYKSDGYLNGGYQNGNFGSPPYMR